MQLSVKDIADHANMISMDMPIQKMVIISECLILIA